MAADDRRPSRYFVATAAALALLGFAVVRGCSTGGEPRAPHQDIPADAPDPADATSPDRRTAATAAVRFATAPQQWLYLTDEEVEAAVREIAAPRRADDLTASVVEDIRDAREGLSESSGPVWWIVRPVAVHVDDLSDDRATVEVWAVTVLSAPEVAAPQAEWRTVGLDLVWIDGDWRVDVVRDTPGPTPMVGPGDRPWDAVPFDEAMEGFVRLDGEVVR